MIRDVYAQRWSEEASGNPKKSRVKSEGQASGWVFPK
jgi:hypothetical protein